jgi:hypothetical protein
VQYKLQNAIGALAVNLSFARQLATVVFWILCGLVVFLPPRWATLAYLMLAQVDITGPDFESASMVGFANIIKIVVLPTLLYLRVRKTPSHEAQQPAFFKIWLLFVGYVAIASVWTQFHLQAFKMVGFLYAYTLLFLIFVRGWEAGWLNGKSFTRVAWVTIIVGTIQTYMLGDAFGSPGDEYSKLFTTFTGAQALAPFLLALLIFVYIYEERRFWKIITCMGLFVAIVLDGSRYVLGATALGFFIMVAGHLIIKRNKHVFRIVTATLLCTVLLGGVTLWAVIKYFPRSRINEVSEAVASPGGGGVEDVADFAWRLLMYQEVIHDLQNRKLGLLLVGSGTSSATVVRSRLDYWHDQDVSDANRVVHNEFLRSLYEWGFCGFTLLTVFVVAIFKNSLKIFFRTRSPGALACLAFFPALLFGLSIENVLVGSGAPDGVGYALIASCLAISQIGPQEETQRGETISA